MNAARSRLATWGRILAALAVVLALLGIPLAESALHPLHLHTAPIERAVQAAAVEADGTSEPAHIQGADGAPLEASWFTPREPNGRAVLLLHGVSDSRLGQLGFAKLFLRHGYSVLAIDSRAHGASGGAMATYGVLERDDMRRWSDWIEVRAPHSMQFAIGMSMGAAILIESIPVMPRLRAVVAECPFSSFRAVAYDRFVRFLPLPSLGTKLLLSAPIEIGFGYTHVRYGISLQDANPERAITLANIPVLLIHGQEDKNIPPQHSERLLQANPRMATLWRVPHAGHVGAWSAASAEFEQRIINFFNLASISR